MSKNVQKTIVETLISVEPSLTTGFEFTPETMLSELGIDSLRLVEVGVLLENAFGDGVQFDDWLDQERAKEENQRPFSLGSLVTFINGAVPQ